MTNTVTLVTAFFDIGREKNGDGRSIDDYKKWIKTTLQLNCNMYIVTEEKFRDFFVQNRPSHLPTKIHIMPFVDSHYYRYYDQMTRIIQSDDYRSKIAHPRRVECVLPEYNVIQYSKFHYLEMAISDNPFHSTHFFWLDAGVSRFFMDVDITRPIRLRTRYNSSNTSLGSSYNVVTTWIRTRWTTISSGNPIIYYLAACSEEPPRLF